MTGECIISVDCLITSVVPGDEVVSVDAIEKTVGILLTGTKRSDSALFTT